MSEEAQSVLDEALALRNEGQLAQAISLCEAQLAAAVDDLELSRLLGIMYAEAGRPKDSARLLARVVTRRPGDVDALMQLGGVLATLGSPLDALSCYERVTSLVPTDPTPLRVRGAMLLSLGRREEAVRVLGEALRLAPNDPDVNCDLGVALDAIGRKQTAIDCFDRAVAFGPDHVSAQMNRAILLAEVGRPADALIGFDRAVALMPNEPAVHFNRGSVLVELERYAEAITAFDRTLALRREQPMAWHNRAVAAARLERRDEALANFERALALDPAFAPAHVGRGKALAVLGRHAEALDSYRRALELAPGDYDALLHSALALVQLERPQEALELLDQAGRVRADTADVWRCRGVALERLGRLEEALASFERAIEIEPAGPLTYLNAGNLQRRLNRHAQAQASYEHALAGAPQDALIRRNLAHLKLSRGDFAGGWPLFEARPGAEAAALGSLPRWDGREALAGRTLLVRAEQGLGDTIQFCRYVRMLEARGANVVFEVPAELVRLLRSLSPRCRLISRGTDPGAVDFQAPLLSLPALLGTELATIPAEVPYLAAEGEATARWATRLAGRRRLRVGIAWSGNVEAERQQSAAGRSLPLAAFAPLAGRPDVQLVSLQKGPGSEQLALVEFAARILDFSTELDTGPDAFIDTAALMTNLDLVITPDTSVAHLAGALARPVWIVLPEEADWRWLLDRDDSPWYPTARLYRRSGGQSWPQLLEAVAAALPPAQAMQGEGDATSPP